MKVSCIGKTKMHTTIQESLALRENSMKFFGKRSMQPNEKHICRHTCSYTHIYTIYAGEYVFIMWKKHGQLRMLHLPQCNGRGGACHQVCHKPSILFTYQNQISEIVVRHRPHIKHTKCYVNDSNNSSNNGRKLPVRQPVMSTTAATSISTSATLPAKTKTTITCNMCTQQQEQQKQITTTTRK